MATVRSQLAARSKFSLLDRQQQVFLSDYLKTFNMTQSAITAGYSKKSAGNTAWRLMKRADVNAALGELMRRHGVNDRRVRVRLAQIAFSMRVADYEPYLDGRCSLADLEADGVDTSLIKKVTETSTTRGETVTVRRTIEFVDLMRALVELASILGMHEDGRNDPSGAGGWSQDELWRRAKAVQVDNAFEEPRQLTSHQVDVQVDVDLDATPATKPRTSTENSDE